MSDNSVVSRTLSQPKHAPRTPFALLVAGLVGGSMCALLALNTASAANEVSRHDLAVKDAAVADSLVQLNNEVAESAAPQNLAAAASRLGMVPAADPAFLVVGADGSVKLLGSPGPVSAPPVYVPPATNTPAPPKPSSSSSKTAAKSKSKKTKHSKTGSATPSATPTPNSTLPGGSR